MKWYSTGMYVRLGFAVAAHLEPDILIVDEVLAVGDAEFQKRCLGRMGEVAREGRTVLFVSHNMQAVRRLCDRGILLQGGRVVEDGSAEQVIQRISARSRSRISHPGTLGQPRTPRGRALSHLRGSRHGYGGPTDDLVLYQSPIR